MDDVDRLDALATMLDRALRSAFESALADRSTTSDEYVMLGVLAGAEGPLTWDALEAHMPAGWGPTRTTDAWNGLAAGGWAVESDGLRMATSDGRAALDDLHGAIEDLHERAREGVSDEDYRAAAAVLTRMLDNLDG